MVYFIFLVYTGLRVGRGLGMRRSGVRSSLHDPFEEGALVLYSPPELTAHDQLTLTQYVMLIVLIIDYYLFINITSDKQQVHGKYYYVIVMI